MLRAILTLAVSLPVLGEEPITRIACGACYKPNKDKGIWHTIAQDKPQAFLFMGDNIYGDTEDMALLKKKYQVLLDQPGFAKFSKEVPVLPIWDDHDYGKNDAGADYPKRVESQKIFLDTFGFPADHPTRKRAGIYHSRIMGPEGKRLQIIMLDTRYFRSKLRQRRLLKRRTYIPQKDPEATMLGKEQWAWLKRELKKTADLRIIVSSIQVIMTDHRFEKWSNIPAEREKFFQLLKESQPGPTVLLSGDRHLAEITKLPAAETGLGFDLFEMTSSGMTHAGSGNYPSDLRVPDTYYSKRNYGLVDIDWTGAKPAVTLIVKNWDGKAVRSITISY